MEKKLLRSRNDKVLSGVCGGLAKYLSLDVTILRIVWAIIAVSTGGMGLIAYVLAAVIIPQEPFDYEEDIESFGEMDFEKEREEQEKRSTYTGLFFIALGAFFLLKKIVRFHIDFDYIWPLIVMGIGVLVISNSKKRG